jgi:hypothetical protein
MGEEKEREKVETSKKYEKRKYKRGGCKILTIEKIVWNKCV